MKFVCDSCAARYKIDDAKVRGKILKVRCKKCGQTITIRAPAQPSGELAAEARRASGEHQAADGIDPHSAVRKKLAESSEPSPASAADVGEDATWHYSVNGESFGPYGEHELIDRCRRGIIGDEAYVWRPDFDGWKPATSVPVFAAAIAEGTSRRQRAIKHKTQGVDAIDVLETTDDAAKEASRPDRARVPRETAEPDRASETADAAAPTGTAAGTEPAATRVESPDGSDNAAAPASSGAAKKQTAQEKARLDQLRSALRSRKKGHGTSKRSQTPRRPATASLRRLRESSSLAAAIEERRGTQPTPDDEQLVDAKQAVARAGDRDDKPIVDADEAPTAELDATTEPIAASDDEPTREYEATTEPIVDADEAPTAELDATTEPIAASDDAPARDTQASTKPAAEADDEPTSEYSATTAPLREEEPAVATEAPVEDTTDDGLDDRDASEEVVPKSAISAADATDETTRELDAESTVAAPATADAKPAPATETGEAPTEELADAKPDSAATGEPTGVRDSSSSLSARVHEAHEERKRGGVIWLVAVLVVIAGAAMLIVPTVLSPPSEPPPESPRATLVVEPPTTASDRVAERRRRENVQVAIGSAIRAVNEGWQRANADEQARRRAAEEAARAEEERLEEERRALARAAAEARAAESEPPRSGGGPSATDTDDAPAATGDESADAATPSNEGGAARSIRFHGGRAVPVVQASPSIPDPSASSGPDRAAVSRVMSGAVSDSFRACARRHRTLDGSLSQQRVTLEVTVAGSGRVQRVRVLEDALSDSTLARCLRSHRERWIFPRFEGDPQPIQKAFIVQ